MILKGYVYVSWLFSKIVVIVVNMRNVYVSAFEYTEYTGSDKLTEAHVIHLC